MKDIDEKYTKKIYLNILKAIIIVLYFFTLNMCYENVRSEYFEIGTKILTMIFLFISIFIFEIAYKKDDGELAISGIEFLILSTYTLTTEHITNKFNFELETYSLVASYLSATYFVLRSIIEYTKGRKEVAQNLSDIKEIVKKEEPVIKEATKKSEDTEKIEEKAELKQEIKKQEKEENKEEKSKSTKKDNNKTKKTTKSKKNTTSKKKTTKEDNKKVKKEVKEND